MKHASATRSAGANRVISDYRKRCAAAEPVACRNLVTTDPFCLRKVKKYDDRPQGFAAFEPGRHSPRSVPMEVVHVDAERPSGAGNRVRRVVAGAVGGRGSCCDGGVLVLA